MKLSSWSDGSILGRDVEASPLKIVTEANRMEICCTLLQLDFVI